MGADFASVVVAVVGVAGTLISPILAQRSSVRSAQVASEAERKIRAEERDAAARNAAIQEKREVYAMLNSLARTCRNVTKDCARHCSEEGSVSPEDLALMQSSWRDYQDCYDGAQMVLPDQVLALASELNTLLGRGYRFIRELAADGSPTPEEIFDYCEGTVLKQVTLMRRTMREDLGVSPDITRAVPHARQSQQRAARPGRDSPG